MEAYVHGVSTRSVDDLVVATGVSIDGTREVLGTAVGDSESFEFWREFVASLKARGLSGVRLVVSDAHSGLKPLSHNSSPALRGSAAGYISCGTCKASCRRSTCRR
jgi:transposase-like protein